jgi:hypothetical protein
MDGPWFFLRECIENELQRSSMKVDPREKRFATCLKSQTMKILGIEVSNYLRKELWRKRCRRDMGTSRSSPECWAIRWITRATESYLRRQCNAPDQRHW